MCVRLYASVLFLIFRGVTCLLTSDRNVCLKLEFECSMCSQKYKNNISPVYQGVLSSRTLVQIFVYIKITVYMVHVLLT